MYQVYHSSHSNLKAIAACHKLCFSNSYGVKLGSAYVCKSFEWFLAGNNRFLLHIEQDKQVIGYCGGFVSQFIGDGSTSSIMQYAMQQAIAGLLQRPWLLVKKELVALYPLIFRNMYKKFFRHTNKIVSAPHLNAAEQSAGLVVIGVHPDFRGKGVFETLMTAFEQETKKRKLLKMQLTVKQSNARAINAYQKAGWEIKKHKKETLEMTKHLA